MSCTNTAQSTNAQILCGHIKFHVSSNTNCVIANGLFRIIEKTTKKTIGCGILQSVGVGLQYLSQLHDLRRGVVLHRCGIVRVGVVVGIVAVHFLLTDQHPMRVVRVTRVRCDWRRFVTTSIGFVHGRILRCHLDPLVFLSRMGGEECE